MKRKKVDEDYNPESEEQVVEKKKKTKPSTKEYTFLNQHAKEIVAMSHKGMQPAAIATALLTEEGLDLRSNAITGKQISGWIAYRKKTGQMKTNPVSEKNNSLKVDFAHDGHSCMLYVERC